MCSLHIIFKLLIEHDTKQVPSLASVLHGNFILVYFFVVYICDSFVLNHKRKKRIRDMQMYVKMSKNHVKQISKCRCSEFLSFEQKLRKIYV